MKKTTQVHIGGRHFIVDEDAFQKLNHYLESLKSHFSSEGETGREIIEDIENRIAELLENKISNGKQVINIEDINETIKVLGKVEDFEYTGGTDREDTGHDYRRRESRRLYRDPENYYFGGVAGGIGAYFDIDPIWVRLFFILLFVAKGIGLLIYLILWLVVPRARTTAEKLQMRGRPVNLNTIKESVNEEYERFKSSDGAGAARTGFENLMKAAGLIIVAFFKFIIAVTGVTFLIVGSVFLAVLIMGLLGATSVLGNVQLWNGIYLTDLHTFFATPSHLWLAIISLVIVVLIPVIGLIYGGVKMLFNVRSHHPVLRIFLLTTWILALVLFMTLLFVNIPNSPFETEESHSTVIESSQPYLIIDSRDNLSDKKITHYRIFNYRMRHSRWDDAFYDKVSLEIHPSPDDQYHLSVRKKIKNVEFSEYDDYMDEVYYNWQINDSVLVLDRYFNVDDDNFWLFSKVNLSLQVPEGKSIMIRPDACEMLVDHQRDEYCGNIPAGKKLIMSPDGALLTPNQN